MGFKSLSSEFLIRHQYFTARRDSYQRPDGFIVDPYFVVELPVSVAVTGITEGKEIVMIRQFRYPVNEILMELPGGFLDEGEQPQQAAERELLEETGYSFSSFHYLGITAANPGVLNNYTHMFLALGGVKTRKQSLDPHEQIEIILKPMDEVRLLLQHNEIRQSMHALCLFHAFEFMKKNNLT
jgi:ADP-ribose pyrophosphatase